MTQIDQNFGMTLIYKINRYYNKVKVYFYENLTCKK